MTRSLSWDGCLNVRDLGGLPIAGGGETMRGRVARAEAPDFLSPRGWSELHAHGVRTLVDLRCPTEGEYAPPDGVRRECVPLFRTDDPELDRRVSVVGDSGEFYRVLVDHCREAIARAVAAVADADLPQPWEIEVHVFNGTQRPNAATRVADEIAGLAYRIGNVGNATRTDYPETRVYYPPGGEAIADRLARELGVRTAALPGGKDPHRLIVIVGE